MSKASARPARCNERLGPIFLAIVFFGAGTAWVAWEMFVTGGDPEMVLQFMNPTASNPIAWLGLVLGSFMVLLALGRLLFARDVVVLEPDQVRFGYGDVEQLPPAVEAWFDGR